MIMMIMMIMIMITMMIIIMIMITMMIIMMIMMIMMIIMMIMIMMIMIIMKKDNDSLLFHTHLHQTLPLLFSRNRSLNPTSYEEQKHDLLLLLALPTKRDLLFSSAK